MSTSLNIDLHESDGSLKSAPTQIDYFQIFGLKRSFVVDPASLSRGKNMLKIC